MIKLINKLKIVSGHMKTFVSAQNKLCVSRERKTDIFDAMLYKLYYSQNGITQEGAIKKINKYKKK